MNKVNPQNGKGYLFIGIALITIGNLMEMPARIKISPTNLYTETRLGHYYEIAESERLDATFLVN